MADPMPRVDEWERLELSSMDRARIKYQATEITIRMFEQMHAQNGWCGDIDEENFRAAWPVVAVSLARITKAVLP